MKQNRKKLWWPMWQNRKKIMAAMRENLNYEKVFGQKVKKDLQKFKNDL